MKKIRFNVLGIFIIILTAVFILILLDRNIPDTIAFNHTNENRVFFDVKKGMTFNQIAKSLADSGIINDIGFFKLLSKIRNIDGKLQAGKYDLQKNMNEYDVLMKIYRGKVLLKKLVIPEGLTMKQIASRIKQIADIDSVKFLNGCSDKNLLSEYKIRGKNCEGFLYPETYYISDDMDEILIIRMMLENFNLNFPDSLFCENSFGFDKYRYIIMASIIEKEAKLNEEKALIAGVYYNRLKKGMLLQCCATVFYALGKTGGILTYKDLEFSSPYNTYKNFGLPPGPISNPGKSSVESVLNPAKNLFLFYVSNGDGTHTFSKTYKEHINAQKGLNRQ